MRRRRTGAAFSAGAAVLAAALASPLAYGPVTKSAGLYVWTATLATLRNQTRCALVVAGDELRQGRWTRRPAGRVSPGGQAEWVTKSAGSGGNEAAVRLLARDCRPPGREGKAVRVHWDNPSYSRDRYDARGTDPAFLVTWSGGNGFHTSVTYTVRDR